MKKTSVVCLLVLTSLVLYSGCTAEVSEADSIAVAKQHLTIDQCESQRDQCLNTSGLLGILTCNLDHTFCLATSTVGLPAAVTTAVDEAAACRSELGGCLDAAKTLLEETECAEQQAICVANILDVQITDIVSGTTTCIDGAFDCIDYAENSSDLEGCAETLTACAIEEASAVLPEVVGDAVNEITSCTFELDDCILDSSTPSELTACAEAEVACVSEGLSVPLPDVPLSNIVGCAENAIDCTLDARSVSSLAECAEGLAECGVDESVEIIAETPAVVDCEIRWFECLLRNPLALIPCSEKLNTCLD